MKPDMPSFHSEDGLDDDICDLDDTKICDNCMKCVTGDAEFFSIQISGIRLENEEMNNQKQDQ